MVVIIILGILLILLMLKTNLPSGTVTFLTPAVKSGPGTTCSTELPATSVMNNHIIVIIIIIIVVIVIIIMAPLARRNFLQTLL